MVDVCSRLVVGVEEYLLARIVAVHVEYNCVRVVCNPENNQTTPHFLETLTIEELARLYLLLLRDTSNADNSNELY